MKKVLLKALVSLVMVMMLVMFTNPLMSQPPPPPGGSHGEGIDKEPAGGGAPLEEGQYILIGLALGYGIYLLAKNKLGKLSFEKLEE